MVTKRRMSNSIVIALIIVFTVVCVILPSGVGAKPKEKRIKDINLDTNVSLTRNLKSLIGKRIDVNLVSGKTLTGVVKSVGKKLLHLEKLEGKEYYDALIRIENISAIETKARRHRR